MKKVLKRFLIILGIVIVLGIGAIAVGIYLIIPNLGEDITSKDEESHRIAEIAEDSDVIDFEEGVLYMNNEVIVVVSPSVEEDSVDELANKYHASIDKTMADIGIIKFRLDENKSYDDLESLIKKLEKEDIVEEVHLNIVSELESDTKEVSDEKEKDTDSKKKSEDEFEYEDAVYPNDKWKNDSWNTDVPRGKNWGMEAIHAPEAWGYSDRMNTVKIGLIDSQVSTSHEDLNVKNSNGIYINEQTGKVTIDKYRLPAEEHGTHVAGTMSATWNNKLGVSGVMGTKSELYYSAVYYEEKEGSIYSDYATSYTYLLALKDLIDQDVQVINISQNTNRLIGFAASRGNTNAINYLTMQADLTEVGLKRIIEQRTADDKTDFVICVAAGNSNSTYYYPDEDEYYGYRTSMTFTEMLKFCFGWRGEMGDSMACYNNFLNLMDDEEVEGRVIVVGAIGIDEKNSTSKDTEYKYAYFSNVGSRVDVVAPGVDIYSCSAKTYKSMDGTSMATPHVTGVAGLVFACNEELTGPQVKKIVVNSTEGRYYYTNGYSGLINAEISVINALKTRTESINHVLKTGESDGLDLCFVVDTTGSMEDDIENAKENMSTILEYLGEKTSNYRVAIVDYRDFALRTRKEQDYASKVQLNLTDDNEKIIEAINGLDLGHGGDTAETVFSGLMTAIGLDWRSDSKKVIVVLGDAPPLEPEPNTNYTYDDVLMALYNADIDIDFEKSDERVVGEAEDYLINVFTIGADASDSAQEFFEQIAKDTGGNYSDVEDASGVSDAIIDSIAMIEVTKTVDVDFNLGSDMAGEEIAFYGDDDYLFSFTLDETGMFELESVPVGDYTWDGKNMYVKGTVSVEEDDSSASVETNQENKLTSIQKQWRANKIIIIMGAAGMVAFSIFVPIVIKKIKKLTTVKK